MEDVQKLATLDLTKDNMFLTLTQHQGNKVCNAGLKELSSPKSKEPFSR
jgi:hypothetical protein